MIQPKSVRVHRKRRRLVLAEASAGPELGLDVEAGLGLVIGDGHLPAADRDPRLAAAPGLVGLEDYGVAEADTPLADPT